MLDLYLVQMDVFPNNKAKNFAKVFDLTAQIHKEQDDPVPGLIILPEMFATGYLPLHPESAAENFSTKDSGETAKFLYELANKTGCAVMGAGIAKGDEPNKQLLNHSSVYLPAHPQEFAHYDKRHPFFMEQGKFTDGTGISLFKIKEWQIAPTVCFDLRFPELYRDAVKKGAHLFTVQAAWPSKRVLHWNTLLKARAIENQAFVAGVNCISSDRNYTGNSQIINPFGEIVAEACENEECVIFARIGKESLDDYRKEFPVLENI